MDSSKLLDLRRQMRCYYDLFSRGYMDKKEYLSSIKPLDKEIDNIEMSLFMVGHNDRLNNIRRIKNA